MAKKHTPTKEPIHSFRISDGKTLDDICTKFPVSPRTLIRWEKGDPRIPVKWLEKAEKVYGKGRAEIRPDIFQGVPQ